jgi:glucose/arabinose dehydrogenase
MRRTEVLQGIFASGLRNPVGLAWEPRTGTLWTAVNERDGLGDETPPDYLTSVRDGGFYGWPYCYWGQTVDDRVPQDPAAVAKGHHAGLRAGRAHRVSMHREPDVSELAPDV